MASRRICSSRGWLGIRRRKLRTALGLPGKKEADIAGHSSWILEHLSLEMEPERSQVLVPEFVTSLGSALQSLFPLGLRVVDPPAAIAAQAVGEAINLDFALSAFGRLADQLHDELQQLLGRPLWRFVKFSHDGFLLFLLLLHMAQFFGSLRRLALGHPVPQISSRKSTDRRATVIGHGSLPVSGFHQRPGMAGNHQILVGLYHVSGDAAVRRADALLLVPVGRFVQFQSEPSAGTTDGAAHRRRILADPGGEYDPVEAAERRRKRGNVTGDTVAEHLDCKARTRILARQELAEVRGNAGEPEHPGAAIEEVDQPF